MPASTETISHAVVNGDANVKDTPKSQDIKGWRDKLDQDDLAVLALRNFIFDICNQNGGGHGGSAVGMAALGVALYKYVMRFNPSNPEWFDRDRFVLSNGHAAMFLYAMNHLTGFDDWTMEEIRGYGSAKTDGYETLCHAHPERELPGIEVTTGPLGQGIANAVGLAIASKNLAARYNRPGFDLVQSRVYCMTGDGCLMEGVALEAVSLAGSLGLDNLVLIYDNNQVTCDGPLDWINTEDVNAKMRATGWHVLEIDDACYDVGAIVSTLSYAKTLKGKPIFINARTIIGIGTSVAGTYVAHHGAFDEKSIARSKQLAGQDPSVTHVIPPDSLHYFRKCKTQGEQLQSDWDKLAHQYETAHPELAADFAKTIKGDYGTKWLDILTNIDSAQFHGKATREANGTLIEKIWPAYPALCGGGADLVNSNKVSYTDSDVFHPTVSYAGRYIRYGIREHAMAAISNGLAAYNPGTFIPITATFLMFYLYVSRQRGFETSPCANVAYIGCPWRTYGSAQPLARHSLCDPRLLRRGPERSHPPTGRGRLPLPRHAEPHIHPALRRRRGHRGLDARAGQEDGAHATVARARRRYSDEGHGPLQGGKGSLCDPRRPRRETDPRQLRHEPALRRGCRGRPDRGRHAHPRRELPEFRALRQASCRLPGERLPA